MKDPEIPFQTVGDPIYWQRNPLDCHVLTERKPWNMFLYVPDTLCKNVILRVSLTLVGFYIVQKVWSKEGTHWGTLNF